MTLCFVFVYVTLKAMYGSNPPCVEEKRERMSSIFSTGATRTMRATQTTIGQAKNAERYP